MNRTTRGKLGVLERQVTSFVEMADLPTFEARKRALLQKCDEAYAVAEVGLRDFGHPRVPCPKGVMRFGAVDGPQIIVDLNTMTISIRSPHAIELASQIRIVMEAPDIFLNGRRVDLQTGDI